jgi:uncharacterized protein (DUF2062 family)
MMTRDAILGSRWLRPFAYLFDHPSLWHLNRRSFPRALAVGLFTAFILPVGQFALAALLAVLMRANVPLAAAATLVSNPFTFPAIYFGAYRLGRFLLPAPAEAAVPSDRMLGTLVSLTGPTMLGLAIFAVLGAASGFVLGTAVWRLRLAMRWRARRARAVGG